MLKQKLPPPEETLFNLIEINSVSGQEGPIAMFLMDFLQRHFEYDFLELQEVDADRFNLIMCCGEPVLTFTSHMDTVPGSFVAAITETAVFGRGACDAKGQIVAQLYAMADAISKGVKDYACFYVIGEEVDSIGAVKVTASSAIGSRFLLNGEPTGNRFVGLSAGVIDFVVKAEGQSMHSSIAGNASAIHKIIPELNALLQENKSDFMINIGLITAPGVANMSCADAVARVCIRNQRDSSEGIALVKDIFKECSVELSGPAIEPYKFYIPHGHEEEAIIVPFCSDSPLYAQKFENIMMYGPGSIYDAHTPQEVILIAELNDAIRTMSALLQTLR